RRALRVRAPRSRQARARHHADPVRSWRRAPDRSARCATQFRGREQRLLCGARELLDGGVPARAGHREGARTVRARASIIVSLVALAVAGCSGCTRASAKSETAVTP